MAVDYRKQYRPDQLEPFWPNEILRMCIVVLCTLAIIMAFAVMPMLLDQFGLGDLVHHEEPADPRAAPAHILPEWYFLSVYQYLKLPPQEFLGISGKTLGVLSQAPFMLAVLLLPLWGRRWSVSRPGRVHKTIVTLILGIFVALTFWAAWPPRTLFLTMFCFAVLLFYLLIWHESRTINRVMRTPKEDAS